MTKEKLAALLAAGVLAVGVGAPAAFAQEATLYSGTTPAAVQLQSSAPSAQAESNGYDGDNVQQGDQNGPDNEKAGAESESNSEKAGDNANDPQEAPGTPGYQEGDFQGEF